MPSAPVPSLDDFHRAVVRLGARPDGHPRSSSSSLLAPVTFQGQPAFLKVTNESEELLGAPALREWDGAGAVRLIAQDGNALLLERAGATMRATLRDDDAATKALSQVARRLHAHVAADLDSFPSLGDRFQALFAASDPRVAPARPVAHGLLARPTRPVLLHGDLHTENVLASGRGWLATDPKGVVGPREFDYGNLFTNWTITDAVARFDARVDIVCAAAGLDRDTLLRWIVAWSALSATWFLADDDEDSAALPLAILDLASARITP